MDDKIDKNECCPPSSCCKVESLVSVDERGQMVLPKEFRERANIKPGEKFAVVSWEKDGQVCCITLVRIDDLSNMVKDFLGPVVNQIWK